jgi:5-methylcytosine-specific restriction endonuclease McrA
VISQNPICADPFGNHSIRNETAPSREVHHIIPLVARMDLGLARSNLMPLCSVCHARIERHTIRLIGNDCAKNNNTPPLD